MPSQDNSAPAAGALGKMIAEKLDYRFLDDQIIQEITQHARVTRNTVISMERS
ncbi:MAG: hypothetical protein R2860_13585 [Desulfobacterales bacterium]